MAAAEGQRNDAGGVIYPGGAFDPLGYVPPCMCRPNAAMQLHITILSNL